MSAGGTFIAVEGPNGVGKSSVSQLLAQRLRACGEVVHLTSEPSATPLGLLVRSAEAGLTGRALALACAADRAQHLETEILPRVAAGACVISDRYVQSSLVLQRIDGLSLEEVWRYNNWAVPPAVSFYLEDDATTMGVRLARRRYRSRLERIGSPGRELLLYREAFEFLAGQGWRQFRVDCRGADPGGVVERILEHLSGSISGEDHAVPLDS